MTIPSADALLQAVVLGLLLGGLMSLSALGLSIVLGVMRLVNLVHGEIVVLGSYTALLLLDHAGLDPLLSLPIVFAGALLLFYPLYRLLLAPVAKYGDEAPLLTAFALSIIGQNLFVQGFTGDVRSLDRPYTRSNFDLLGVTVPTVYLIGFGVALAITALVYLLMTRTGLGRRMRASAEDPAAAAIVGVPVGRVHALTYALGAALAAVGGILIALCFSFTPASGTEYLLLGFTVVVLGGLGSVFGTFAGGLVLGVLQAVGALLFGDGYRTFVGLVLFLVILALRPQGLFRKAATA
ncbi:branched-chain amino acid ABC transporter permease [Jatrophihabitans fulvus]